MHDVTRTIRLNLRLRGYERQMLNAAAAQCGQYVTEFSRDAALERARSVLGSGGRARGGRQKNKDQRDE